MPVGKGSIARATNASNGNTDSKDKAVKEKPVQEKPVQEVPNILTEIPVTQIMEVPTSWKKKIVNVPRIPELMKSILKFGMLEPVIVRRLGDNQFQLLSGSGRLQAVKELGLGTITARVFDGISDSQAKTIYQDLHRKEETVMVEEKPVLMILNDQVEDQQKQSNQASGQKENIHELKFKAVTTLSRDMPDYLL